MARPLGAGPGPVDGKLTHRHTTCKFSDSGANPEGLAIHLLLVGVPVLAQLLELIIVEDKEGAHEIAKTIMAGCPTGFFVKVLVIEDVKTQLSRAVFGEVL